MGQVTIGVREEVYDRLSRLKREGESFSDLFERLAEEDKPAEGLLEFAGSWREHGVEAERVKERLEEERESFESRL